MIQKFKTSLSVCAIIAIVIHFVLITSFINPVKKAEGKLFYYSMFYVYPFFDQGWNLFAPVPNSNYHVYVTYKIGSEKKQFDLINEIQNKHASNRIGGYESLSLAISNAIHSFEGSTKLLNKINGPIKNDITFTIVEHFVNQYVNQLTHNKASETKFILTVMNVVNQQQRVYFN